MRRGGRTTGRRTNAEWSAETQAALLSSARRAFQTEGYDAASVERIAAAATVTKGAVYHHYADKLALFRAVFEEVERDLVEAIERVALRQSNPYDGILRGCEAFLDIALDAEMAQIVLIDGPRVLGWGTWRQIDAATGGRSLREGLDAAMHAGLLVRTDTEVLATLISGALNEAALMCIEARDPRERRKAVRAPLRRLLAGLRR